MKKIYILAAVIALLSLSLNAQVESKQQNKHVQVQKAELKGLSRTAQDGNISFNDMLRGTIKGMSSILPEGQGQMRAPLRYDATQYFTLGPFEGDNFDFGYGFPGAYDANQDVTITTQLQQSEYENHIGDEIVGFRLALYGDGTKMAKVDEFVVHPSTSTSILNGGYAWSLKDLRYENPEGGDEPPTVQVPVYDNIVITSSGSAVNIRSITVYSESSAVSGGSWSYTSNGSTLPTGWSSQSMSNYSTGSCIYLSSGGSITIPHSLIDGKSNITVVINTNQDSGTNYVYVNSSNQSQPAQPLTTTYTNYTWSIAPSGYSTSGGSTQTIEYYKKITSTDELTSGGQYLIVYESGNRAFNGGLSANNIDASGNYISVNITDNTIPANATTDAAAFTITANGNYYRIMSASGYYIGRSTNSNGITTSTTTSTDINNTITFNSGNVNIKGTATRYMRYNTQTNQFRYLSNTGGAQVQLYKRVTETVEVPSSGSVDGDYVNLATGQWHEFYLDQPVEFQMPTEATSLLMGYDYLQYTSSNTSQVLNPAAFNSQSTGHSHYVHLIQGSSSSSSVGDITISVPSGFTVSFYDIEVLDGNTFEVLTSWNSDGAIGGTYNGNNYYSLPTGWTISSTYFYQENAGSADDPVYLAYLSTQNAASITIANSALQGSTNVIVYILAVGWEDGQTVSVNGSSQTVNNAALTECEWDNVFGVPVEGWYGFSTNPAGDLAVQLIFKEAKTPSPTITGQVDPNDENNYVITATGDGTVTLTVGDQTVTGSGTASITIPRTDVDQTVTATATAQDGDLEESNPTTEEFIVPKLVTASPTITFTPGDVSYTITATGNGTVTLTIGDQTVTSDNGTVSITIPRTNVDQIITATATAQEIGKAVSEPTTQEITVPMLPVTPTPEITYTQTNATVVITATGEGTVYLEAGGQTATGEGTVSITIMRSIEDQTVTASAVAVAANHQPSAQALESVPVPALTGTPATAQEGLLRMHLLIADQLKAEIPDNNSHPDRYGYVLRWEQPASVEDHKESGTVEVEIQKTEAKVNGYYTLDQIDADVNVGINHDLGLTMDVLTADASMFLPGENPDVLYYQMQGKEGENPGLGVDYLTQLQYMKNVKKYEEMLATSPNKTHQYPANETYHYFNDSEPILTGIYNDVTSFITYAPSVSTWGVQRRYFEVDHLDNTYGAPIWKTAVGQVKLNSAVHERQTNQWNSVNWKDEGGNDCSLYILDNIEAEGYLPHTGISNVEYEPYMFRVFVESKNGKLRPYTVVPQGDGDHDGEHLVAGTGTTTGPICVWSGYYMDGDVNGMTFSGPRASETVSGQMKYVFTKVKVDRSTDNVVNPWDDLSDPWNDFDTITDPETGAIIKIVDTNRGKANAMFGALDNLAEIIGTDEQGKPIYAPVSEDDLKVFVRFYYVAAGTADGHVPDSRAGGAAYPAGYGTESPGKAPSPWTIVNELRYHGEIVSQTYVNTMGMQSDRPFDGVNIVITRYSDGTTSTTKVLR